MIEGRRIGSGPGAGDEGSGSGFELPNLGLPLPLPGRGESARGRRVDTGLEPPSMDTGREPPLPLDPPEWRDRDAGGGPRRGPLAGRTNRSARLGPAAVGDRGWLARIGEALMDVCWRAARVGVKDSSSWERKREERRDSRVSIWKCGERR